MDETVRQQCSRICASTKRATSPRSGRLDGFDSRPAAQSSRRFRKGASPATLPNPIFSARSFTKLVDTGAQRQSPDKATRTMISPPPQVPPSTSRSLRPTIPPFSIRRPGTACGRPWPKTRTDGAGGDRSPGQRSSVRRRWWR